MYRAIAKKVAGNLKYFLQFKAKLQAGFGEGALARGVCLCTLRNNIYI